MALAATVIAAAAATALARAPSDRAPHWHPWFEIGGAYNSRSDDGTGSFGTSRGETTIFAPIQGGRRALLFSQVTAKFFEDSASEGNLAFGYRHMMPSGFNLGAWIGADVRNTEIDNTFWQLSGGFEALSDAIDLRINWYGPVTKPQSGVAGFAQLHLQGSQLTMTGGSEVGLIGVDGEIGFRLPTAFANLDPRIFELRTYFGGYYFDHSDAIEEVAGVKGRLEFRVNDVIPTLPGARLTAEYEVSHDSVRDTRHEVGMRLRIPLSGDNKPVSALASLTGQQRRMLDGLERDTDIVTVRSKSEKVEDALTGTNFDRVAYASSTSDVTTTSTTAGANALIILNGEVTGGQMLQGDQTLQGGGSTISVRGRASGTVLSFTAPGAAGSLTTPGATDDNLLLGGSNTHVAGLTIVGPAGGGLGDGVDVGSYRRNIFLTNLNIADAADDSVDVEDDSQVTIINLTATTPFESGIDISDDSQVTIVGGSITDTGLDGIEISDDNVITITGMTISNAAWDGIFMDSGNRVELRNVVISDPGIDAIFAGAGNTLFVSGTTFNGTVPDDVFDFAGPGNTVISGSTGNVNNATVAGRLCRAEVFGTFTGTITFVDGTVLTDDVAPCN